MSLRSIETLASPLLSLLERELENTTKPIFVALDGRSGAGKSTLAAYIAQTVPNLSANAHSVSIIEGDEFFTGGSLKHWSSRSANENAQAVIDWQKQRSVITALKLAGVAEWAAFDWNSEGWDSDKVPYCAETSNCSIAPIVLMEGVYSARRELQDLFDLRVLLEIPIDICRAQILAREGGDTHEAWNQVWASAESHYFEHHLERDSLNLILK